MSTVIDWLDYLAREYGVLALIFTYCYVYWMIWATHHRIAKIKERQDQVLACVEWICDQLESEEDEPALNESVQEQFPDWTFDYDPNTKFVGGSHPNGGKNSIAHIVCNNPTRDRLGQEIAEWMNDEA